MSNVYKFLIFAIKQIRNSIKNQISISSQSVFFDLTKVYYVYKIVDLLIFSQK